MPPRARVALLWHQHQPLYRDLAAPMPAGSLRLPWVRLHALRDYLGMALIVAAHPGVRVTFNLTPCLVDQIQGYLDGATDRALELTLTPAEQLTAGERAEIMASFFDADEGHQIMPHRRYHELLEARRTGRELTVQELRDLQMWFNLAWFAVELRRGEVPLPTGEVASVARFVDQQRDFSVDDVGAMVGEQRKVLRAIIPLHRALQQAGQIEISTTPYYHPILPILIDASAAVVDRPGTAPVPDLGLAQDAEAQVSRAVSAYERWFGAPPRGMWPAEGAVSPEAVALLHRAGVQWIASDQGVLARSGRWGYEVHRPEVRHTVYRAGSGMAVFFRDTQLSDAIGFSLQRESETNPPAAADRWMEDLLARARSLPAGGDHVITVVLDGENAWGAYPDDGRPFLHALYDRLAHSSEVETVTFSGFLRGDDRVPAHPVDGLAAVEPLATGSWIDEPASAPGVDLGTWIGEHDENAAWSLVAEARRWLDAQPLSSERDRARESLLAAEGSDWFWWLGDDQDSGRDGELYALFRRHLANVYRLAGGDPPAGLE